MLDVVLQVAHQHQVTGLVPAGVERVVVDVAQDGAGSDTVGAILCVDELAETVHDHSAVLPFALLLVLLRLHTHTHRRLRRYSVQKNRRFLLSNISSSSHLGFPLEA